MAQRPRGSSSLMDGGKPRRPRSIPLAACISVHAHDNAVRITRAPLMKIIFAPSSLALVCGLLIGAPLRAQNGSAPGGPSYETALSAIRNGDVRKLTTMLDDRRVLDLRDAEGTPLLMQAAFYLNAAGLKLFLDKGADVNATNQTGSSALMWAAGDREKVRLLLKKGANVNAASSRGNTPLIIAAFQYGSAGVLRQLLEASAEVNARNNDGDTAVVAAAQNGDCEALRLLMEHKADVKTASGPEGSPVSGGNVLMNAALYGHLEVVKLLMKNGADVNAAYERGNALHWAALTDRRDVADFLLRRGINVNVTGNRLHSFRTDAGYTPLMYAAMTERDDPDLVKVLIEHGADVNAKSAKGESALHFARQRGNTKVVAALRKAGATDTGNNRAEKTKTLWGREDVENLEPAVVRKSVESALHVLVKSGATFTEASANRCFSCHQQTLPAIAFGLAREKGFVYDQHVAGEELKDTLRAAVRRKDQAFEGPLPVPSISALLLLGLHASGYQPDTLTDAYVYSLARAQFRDGRWITSVARAPTDYSDVTSTVLAMRALQLYAPPTRKQEYAKRVATAASWLRGYHSKSTEERALQLLGLYWAGASHAEISKLAGALMKEQRSDGGWAQLPTLESDAYATGETLFALHVAGVLEADAPVYRRGAKFLLTTQCEDGSWFVATRAFPVQKAMDGIFPHGSDQWISSSATSWASMALMLSERPSAPRSLAASRIGH